MLSEKTKSEFNEAYDKIIQGITSIAPTFQKTAEEMSKLDVEFESMKKKIEGKLNSGIRKTKFDIV